MIICLVMSWLSIGKKKKQKNKKKLHNQKLAKLTGNDIFKEHVPP